MMYFCILAGRHHWVYIGYGFSRDVQLLDSMGLLVPIGRLLILQMASICKYDGKTLPIEMLSVQQQDGTLDCGLFSIAFAVELCVGRDPVRAFFDQKKKRQHLY